MKQSKKEKRILKLMQIKNLTKFEAEQRYKEELFLIRSIQKTGISKI